MSVKIRGHSVRGLGTTAVLPVSLSLMALCLGACGGSSRASNPRVIGTPASEAARLCGSAFPGHALNSVIGTIEEVRSLKVGPGYSPAPNAFAHLPQSQEIAWCWTGAPGHYVLYAVASGQKPVRVEALLGPNASQTPEPGPAPIP